MLYVHITSSRLPATNCPDFHARAAPASSQPASRRGVFSSWNYHRVACFPYNILIYENYTLMWLASLLDVYTTSRPRGVAGAHCSLLIACAPGGEPRNIDACA